MEQSIEPKNEEVQDAANNMEFYVVSQRKFLILFIGTFGMYAFYWFFRHWQLYKNSTNEDMWPIMRALFSIFFAHSLFALFEAKYQIKNGEAPKSINHLATIYVVFSIGCHICGRLSDNGYGVPFTTILSLLVLPVSCWALLKAQSLANYAGEDVLGESNNQLSGLNYFWLALGALFWGLVLLGLFAIMMGV
ncbi:hypothetical protein HG263_12955 [Pseudoalteromonas sp. JBTF-M23]|uniref:DUF4234 domain-containing protein n=1 Tax=Pseudoalteromonas caenipelagi TaxID=2726988 RepID=A0A849VCN9_9GAMM|nr:hypothetical protein [Pseudoalteromonas caenipelagi]NOU51439.1 hypothetical protein [Pseudoalteromonas caenipelagi]